MSLASKTSQLSVGCGIRRSWMRCLSWRIARVTRSLTMSSVVQDGSPCPPTRRAWHWEGEIVAWVARRWWTPLPRRPRPRSLDPRLDGSCAATEAAARTVGALRDGRAPVRPDSASVPAVGEQTPVAPHDVGGLGRQPRGVREVCRGDQRGRGHRAARIVGRAVGSSQSPNWNASPQIRPGPVRRSTASTQARIEGYLVAQHLGVAVALVQHSGDDDGRVAPTGHRRVAGREGNRGDHRDVGAEHRETPRSSSAWSAARLRSQERRKARTS